MNSNSSFRTLAFGASGCLGGCFVAVILAAYPVPALVALIVLLVDPLTDRAGEYIYPVVFAAYLLLPLLGMLIGVHLSRRGNKSEDIVPK